MQNNLLGFQKVGLDGLIENKTKYSTFELTIAQNRPTNDLDSYSGCLYCLHGSN